MTNSHTLHRFVPDFRHKCRTLIRPQATQNCLNLLGRREVDPSVAAVLSNGMWRASMAVCAGTVGTHPRVSVAALTILADVRKDPTVWHMNDARSPGVTGIIMGCCTLPI